CQRDLLADELADARVAAAPVVANHKAAYEIAIPAMHRSHQIESGGVDIAGLDAVDALDLSEQMVVVGDRLATEGERADREIFVIAREAFLDGAPERGLIARRGDLIVV